MKRANGDSEAGVDVDVAVVESEELVLALASLYARHFPLRGAGAFLAWRFVSPSPSHSPELSPIRMPPWAEEMPSAFASPFLCIPDDAASLHLFLLIRTLPARCPIPFVAPQHPPYP